MKIKKLAWMMMAALAFVSCSDKEILTTTETGESDGNDYSLNAQLVLPELSQTRAGELPEFSHGDEKEWYVKNSQIYFEFFSASGVRLGVRTPNVQWEAPNPEGHTVTRASAEITISAQMKPKYLVVYLNVPDEEYSNLRRLTLEDLTTGLVSYDAQGSKHAFRPGRDYLGDENNYDKATFAKMPVAFRNMMKERYASLEDNGSFLMTNSSFEEDGKVVRQIDISDYLYDSSLKKDQLTDKQKTGVNVFLERVVAKVNTSIALKSGSKAKEVGVHNGNRVFEVPQMDNSTKAGTSMYVEFQGWQLNATNKSFIPLKNIGHAGDLTTLAKGKVAVHGTGRSFWAYDLNYTAGNGDYLYNSEFNNNAGATYKADVHPALNYYSLANMEALKFGNGTDLGQADYCFENTMGADLANVPSAITHVLVRAQYMKKNGSEYEYIPAGECIYRWGNTIYEESEIKEEALKQLKVLFATDELTLADIKLVHNNHDFNSREDVKSHIVCEKLIGKTYPSLVRDETLTVPNEIIYRATDQKGERKSIAYYKGDVTEAVLGAANLYTFERGVCYYTIPIKHFPELGLGNEGYYGVVRNHWYQILIEDIVEFGHPATPGDPENPGDPDKPGPENGGDPGKPIIPEDITDQDYALNARININAWAKKPFQATIGGSQAWK